MTTSEQGTYATTDDFFEDCRDSLSVHAVEVEPGAWDIVLRIDGTYFDRDTAMEITESFARDIRCLLDHLDPSSADRHGGAA